MKPMMSLRHGVLMFMLILSACRAESVQLDHEALFPSSSQWETMMSNEKYHKNPFRSHRQLPFDDNTQEFHYNPHRLITTRKFNTVQSQHEMVLSRQVLETNGSASVTVLNSTINQGAKALLTISNIGDQDFYSYNFRIVQANDTNGTYDRNDARADVYRNDYCSLVTKGYFDVTVPVGNYKIALSWRNNIFIGFSNSFEVKPISFSVTVPKTEMYIGETVELQFDPVLVPDSATNGVRCRFKNVTSEDFYTCNFRYVYPKPKLLIDSIMAGTYQLEFYLSYSTDIDTKESYKTVSNRFTIKDRVGNLTITISTSSIVQGQPVNALIKNDAGFFIGIATYIVIYANYSGDITNARYLYSGVIDASSSISKLVLNQIVLPGSFKLIIVTYDRNQLLAVSTNFTVTPFTAVGRNISIVATKTVTQGDLVIFSFNIADLVFSPYGYAYGIFPSRESNYINGTRYDKYLRSIPSTNANTNKAVFSIEANWERGSYKMVLLLQISDNYNGEIGWTKLGESNEFVVTSNQPTKPPVIAPSKSPSGTTAPTKSIGRNQENASITVAKASIYQGEAATVVITSISGAPLGYADMYVIPANDPVIYTRSYGGQLQGGASTETTRIFAYATPGSYKLALAEIDGCGNRSNIYGVSNLFEIKAHPKNITTIVASRPVYQNDLFLLNISNSEFQMNTNLFFFSLYHANTTNLQSTQLEFYQFWEIDNARKSIISFFASWPLGMYKIIFFLVTEGAQELGDPFCIPIAETRFTVQNKSATSTPSIKPSAKPTVKPTTKPTVKPTTKPTVKPTLTPIAKPCLSRNKLCKVGAKPCCSKLKCRRRFFLYRCWL